MKIVNSAEMKKLDSKTIEELGLPSLVLMERASLGVIELISRKCINLLDTDEPALIIAGIGNNGADGLVIARLLSEKGKGVKIVLLGDSSKRTTENKTQLEIVKKLGLEIFDYSSDNFSELIENSDLIIDAIFGVGLSRNIEGIYKDVIGIINNSKALKIAVDIPTGINSDTGEILGVAVKADFTVTFSFIKIGLLMEQALEYVGKLNVVDIGIPKLYQENINITYSDKEYIRKIRPELRKENSYKNKFGRTCIIGGSEFMSGAIVLATKACLKSGSGLVNVIVPEDIHTIVASQVPTAMVKKYKGNSFKKIIEETIDSADSIVFGPGAGDTETTELILEYLLKEYTKTLVIDADGLNVLAKNMELLKNIKSKLILTPHLGEMARLLNIKSSEIAKDKIKAVREFIAKYPEIVLVLKGTKTIIADNNQIFMNSTGNPILARGGSGDILSGIVGSLLSQKLSSIDAATFGVYLHGLMGDIARNELNENAVITEELIKYISDAFNEIMNY